MLPRSQSLSLYVEEFPRNPRNYCVVNTHRRTGFIAPQYKNWRVRYSNINSLYVYKFRGLCYILDLYSNQTVCLRRGAGRGRAERRRAAPPGTWPPRAAHGDVLPESNQRPPVCHLNENYSKLYLHSNWGSNTKIVSFSCGAGDEWRGKNYCLERRRLLAIYCLASDASVKRYFYWKLNSVFLLLAPKCLCSSVWRVSCCFLCCSLCSTDASCDLPIIKLIMLNSFESLRGTEIR